MLYSDIRNFRLKEASFTMINIYICEDNSNQLQHLNQTIEHIISTKKYPMSVECYSTSPSIILDTLTSNPNKNIGLYFLDIDLNADIDGFDLAMKIRELDPRGFIVFVTTHSELLHLTFEYLIEPLGYIIKDSSLDIHNQIEKCMSNAATKYQILNKNSGKQVIIFSTFGTEYIFEPMSLIYITVSCIPHTLEICSDDKLIQCRGTINSTVKQLPDYFLQISRDTIINVFSVVEYDKNANKVVLKNGTEFDVPRRKYNIIKKMQNNK